MTKWSIKQTNAPATEPVTLDEAKAHLRVDWPDDDTYISALIIAARRYCEDYQRRAYVTQDFNLYLDQFPGISGEILIPRPPLQSIKSVKYTDNDGNQYIYDPSNYNVDDTYEPGRLVLGWGKTWPVTTLTTARAIEIAFTAGYGTDADVPQVVKQAMMILIAHWYENRELVVAERGVTPTEVPMSVEALLTSNRVYPFEPTGDC